MIRAWKGKELRMIRTLLLAVIAAYLGAGLLYGLACCGVVLAYYLGVKL